MFVFKKLSPKPAERTENDEQRGTETFVKVIGGISLTIALVALIAAIIQDQLLLFVISALFVIVAITCLLTLSKVWDAAESIKLLTIALALEIALAFSTAIFSFLYGFPIAFTAIIIAFLFTVYNRGGWLNNFIISIGMVGALVGLTLRVLSPFTQISNIPVDVFIGLITAAALIMFIQLLVRGQITFPLRIKLIMSALAIALLPLVIIALINSRITQNAIQTQSNETLRIATKLTADTIDGYLSNTLNTIKTESSLPSVVAYMSLAPSIRAGSDQEINLITTLKSLQINESSYTPEFGVYNVFGTDVYDTVATKKGSSIAGTDYYQRTYSTGSSTVSSVDFDPQTSEATLHFIAPIIDTDQSRYGYLSMSIDARVLQVKLQGMAGVIGTHSYPILLDENGLRIGDTSSPNLIYHFIQPIDAATYTSLASNRRIPTYIEQASISSVIPEIAKNVIEGRSNPLDFFSVNMQQALTGIPDTATYSTLTNQKWTVVFLQEQSAVVAAQQSLVRTTALIAILMAAVVTAFTTIASNAFTRPILDLTDSAVRISAGDLTTSAKITSRDEIGILGNAFNSMTKQLRESIETLESRVRERTQQLATQNEVLQYRSRQLQTVADVARSIVTTTDFESLLNSITALISDRFNYYHVGIFLIDELGEYAVLRASNSAGGQRMLDRQHKLKVGQVGIVGYVTGSGQPRIATDVGKDAVFFNNPDLPETKSEMALPLKIEDRVIGALDIQSTLSNAFSEEDISLFTTLADQVATAINTNQLLANTEKALAESENLHRQYLDQEWTKRSSEFESTNFKYTSHGLVPTSEELPEIRMVFDSNRPVTRSYLPENKDSEPYSVLAIPILLRGQAIGVIHLRQNGDQDFVWSENELVTAQNVADQVAQTLESARLFEQTIRRADRERRVLEITNKIRSTNEPQKMLEVTLEELQRHLGASQTQIVINVPGITSSLSNPAQSMPPVNPPTENERLY